MNQLRCCVKLILIFTLLVSCNSKGKLIDEVVGNVTSSAELGTVEYSITKLIKTNDKAFYKFGDRKIIFSCKATMKAGVDLRDFSKDDVTVSNNGKDIFVVLPAPKVLALNIPAEDIKLEYSKVSGLRNSFNTEERNELLKQGEAHILEDVPNLGILDDAKENSIEFFKALLVNCGFVNINIGFKEDVKK